MDQLNVQACAGSGALRTIIPARHPGPNRVCSLSDGYAWSCGKRIVSASRHVRAMLESWPTPKHSDDKTLACLCRTEATDA